MHPYIVYQDTRFRAEDLHRRAEQHRIVADALRERRADAPLPARPRRRPGSVLHRLLPAALTGSRR